MQEVAGAWRRLKIFAGGPLEARPVVQFEEENEAGIAHGGRGWPRLVEAGRGWSRLVERRASHAASATYAKEEEEWWGGWYPPAEP